MALTIKSPAFNNGSEIPVKYTGAGSDISPPLTWEGAPSNTKSFVVICDDPDAPMGTWVHWVIYDIPENVNQLAEGIPAASSLSDGTKQGANTSGGIGYEGPYPPPGPAHRYFFKLYALDTVLNLGPGAAKSDILKKIEGHILDKAETMGTFKR